MNRERITLWLLDRGAYWTESIGEILAGPWYRLSGWFGRKWWERQAKPIPQSTPTPITYGLVLRIFSEYYGRLGEPNKLRSFREQEAMLDTLEVVLNNRDLDTLGGSQVHNPANDKTLT